jgi:hypothetical protein
MPGLIYTRHWEADGTSSPLVKDTLEVVIDFHC